MTEGTATAAATKPAAAGSPVRAKTLHGHTMPAIELPSADIPAEPRYIQIFTTETVRQNRYHKNMSAIDIKKAKKVNTATVVSAGLLGGFITARESGIRPLGGVVLAAAGGWAARSWLAKTNVPTTVGLTALYIGAFGASHPLAKKIGPWPAVFAVTGATAGAAPLLSDSK